MNFGRLLATGKSLVNGDVSGRYRMEKKLQLPKFISPRNPFKQESVAEPVSPPAEAAAPAVTLEPAAPVVAVTSEVMLPADKVLLSARLSSGLQRLVLFCLDNNPFSAIGKPKLSGIPRFGKSGVQGELSLDRVKVVRNDLAHADLEVVRAGRE
jgi:hypothetical protein